MERKFVYPADQKQEYLREIARETNLTPNSRYESVYGPVKRGGGQHFFTSLTQQNFPKDAVP